MAVNKIKDIIKQNHNDLAFVIGNGVNRYPNNACARSWDDLLIQLWDKVSPEPLVSKPHGISLTEFYDVLDIENIQNVDLQKEVAILMKNWQPLCQHSLIIDKIRNLDVPLLTTNFDETIARTFDYQQYRTEQDGFTDFYPWTTYHGNKQLNSPTDGFGIWYINGMISYYRSIRLGLSHYMGSVERARNLLHKGDEERLFSGKNVSNWKGYKTWLHIVFNKSLFVFGLGLEENETFIRWILIERIKYFKAFPERSHKAWYINIRSNSKTDQGKKFFLERVGFEVIDVDDFSDIYEKIWV
ncbi:MAG: hypothetical protein RBS19_05385 [Bacteroidales bacterium]|nr:hypothetical protein [Bacteroidales bacterium]MDY0216369.1 hypothetical protein [Bacteroidales bacterium]